MNAEMKEFLEALGAKMEPMVADAVKAAVAIAAPAAAPFAVPVIDAVDALVLQLTGGTAPAAAVAAPADTDSRVAALERHVAALTVATGHASTSAMANTKAAVPVAAPVADAA